MSRQTLYLPNVEAYDRWSQTYDTDGNILQAVDSLALQSTLMPFLLKELGHCFANGLLAPSPSQDSADSPITANALRITDLGCGTGRAILRLLDTFAPSLLDSDDGGVSLQPDARQLFQCISYNRKVNVRILGLDASSGMLSMARSRVPRLVTARDIQSELKVDISTKFEEWDANHAEQDLSPAHSVISTLVLEHLTLEVFFTHLSKCLLPEGLAVVTNMHSDMGHVAPRIKSLQDEHSKEADISNTTGAGFIDPDSGNKIRAEVDHVHKIPDVLEAAKTAGFELLTKEVEERMVERWMLEPGEDGGSPLLGERGRKWLGVKVWFGMIFQKSALATSVEQVGQND